MVKKSSYFTENVAFNCDGGAIYVCWQSGVGGSRVAHLWYAVVTSYHGAAGHVAHPAARGGISVVSEITILYDRILPEQRTVAQIVRGNVDILWKPTFHCRIHKSPPLFPYPEHDQASRSSSNRFL